MCLPPRPVITRGISPLYNGATHCEFYVLFKKGAGMYQLIKKIVLLFLLLPVQLFAQTPVMTWNKSYGGTALDDASGIVKTSSGGFAICGKGSSNDGDITGYHGSGDFWIVNCDPAGNIIWQHTYGGTSWEYARCIASAPDNGFFVGGTSYSSDGDVTYNHGDMDGWVIKTDMSGNLEWQISLGGPGLEQFYAISATVDGGCIVVGFTDSIGGDVSHFYGSSDIWVVKLDLSGHIQWEKAYGGSAGEIGSAILQTNDNGYMIGGFSISTDGDLTSVHGGTDVWIIKTDSGGNIIWQKTYGGTGFEGAEDILPTKDGGFVVVGQSNSVNGDLTANYGGYFGDCWLFKIDAAGQLQWQKNYGGSGNDIGRSVSTSLHRGYIISGSTESNDGQVDGNHGLKDYWVIETDDTGNLLWQKTLGGSANDESYGVIAMADSSYIVAGFTGSSDGDITSNHGFDDYWVVNLKAPSLNIIDEKAHNNISIYPNVTNGLIHINLPGDNKTFNIELYDIVGRLLNKNSVNGTHTTYRLNGQLIPGPYYLRLYNETDSKSFKIFLQ